MRGKGKKTAQGTLIKPLKYNEYQDLRRHKKTGEQTPSGHQRGSKVFLRSKFTALEGKMKIS